ncbi:MAG TPA: SHOCT domain-containing protein [Chloroflexota bacterium]|nr:SHOCT domain-containing protein [Chloroflexota bacterium]HUM67811.1 SHOCT domain-containing protein [Chloroflexota bacterium]
MRRRGPIGGRAMRRTVRRARRRRIRMRRRRMMLVGGMVAIAVAGTSSAIKMSQQDAQRIEQHTGMKPEDLSEEQLEQALNDLEIDTDELTDAEVAAIEAADAEPEAAPAAPSTPAAPVAQDDFITQIERLGALRDQGLLTDEEFEAKKKQILGL